ncbi:phosphoribosyl-AMP cyclohydrolase [Hyphomicrobium sulfonivorans]|uniref:phosphoribosyl-AMP cyclohydrolase n=1 Tax=Hyphomicrobium sulfonivorans TaxID=121290 RepID=UPI00156E893A|nr:phosphoribosyl-AMP cyclohydrolase [Hyphomicrobium sulfonivorans]MBI1650635.1 phosphoribosyl-AMP cyclohydrolase [Hyphomicrobium sulfonivorans]NSL72006.1 phosphoribosyl-AMP cyclohydrolase [Hyphomicrobium sulfonivorans]
MSAPASQPFATRGTKAEIENGLSFQPKFDGDGLIPAIVTDARTGEVLMFAFMNAHALKLSIDTGIAHFWSRSRAALWKKGEESGNFLNIVEMRTDCDQDVIWVRVDVAGDGRACHTGERSCFYRVIKSSSDADEAAALTVAADACRHD